MESGQSEELPDDVRAEKWSMLSGRLRAALLLNGISPTEVPHRPLIDFLASKGVTVDRRTAWNWFQEKARRIQDDYLFDVASALGVRAKWLTMNQGPMRAPVVLQEEHERIVAIWRDLDDDDARRAWVRHGRWLLAEAHKTGTESPFSQATPGDMAGSRHPSEAPTTTKEAPR